MGPKINFAYCPSAIATISSPSPAFPSYFDLSVGAQNIGKVDIDCCLKLSQCRRGFESGRPAILLYFDIHIEQPGHYVLESASVLLTLGGSATLEVTDYFGPKKLQGGARQQTYNRVRQIVPNLAATFPLGSVNLSGIGDVTTTDITREWHWGFYGNRKPDTTRRYTSIHWIWDGSRLGDRVPCQTLKCGIIVHCDHTESFEISVKIAGKLKGIRGLLQRFSFGSQPAKVDKFPPISPSSFRAPPPDLETLKHTINEDMLRENQDEQRVVHSPPLDQVAPAVQTAQQAPSTGSPAPSAVPQNSPPAVPSASPEPPPIKFEASAFVQVMQTVEVVAPLAAQAAQLAQTM